MDIQFTNFEKLKKSIERYGIFKLEEKSKQIKKIEDEGLDLDDLSELFSSNSGELFVILEDGSIRKIVIHIVDISSWSKKWNYPRFHIYECETIVGMKNQGRKHRYRVSSRTDGKFYLIKNDKKWSENLKICSHCLSQYNQNFKNNKTKETFSLKKWIDNPISNSGFHEMELDICTVPNCYTKSWAEISKKRKEQAGYICQNCKKDFSSKICKEFLHTHHKNSDRKNNTKENLKVLCIECHSKEYNHQHIRQSSQYKKWLKSNCKIQIKNPE